MLDTKFWHKYFKVYDILNLVIPYQDLLNEIMKELDVKRNDLILDAGVGTGNLAVLLEKEGARVMGLDFSKEALDIYKSKNPKVEIILADLTKKLPFPNNHFDKIVSNNTLYALPEKIQSLCVKEFYRILKLGGKVVISNPKQGWSVLAIYSNAISSEVEINGIFKTVGKIIKMILPTTKIFYYNHFIKKEVHYHFFKIGEQKMLLEKAGFIGCYEKPVYAEQAILVGAYKP